MTDTLTPTNEQIIERIAEFMGWERHCDTCGGTYVIHYIHGEGGCHPCEDCSHKEQVKHDWNPLHDWNHWRAVEEKIMEDEELFQNFIHNGGYWTDGEYIPSTEVYLKSTLEERCKALIEILPTP